MVSLQLILPPIISVILSGIVSWKIAAYSAERQFELQNRQRERDWYERSITLAETAENKWWDVMNSGEKEWDVKPVEAFRRQRDELRQHSAEGKALNVDDDLHQDLEQAAASFEEAIQALELGNRVVEIEQNLLPRLDEIKNRSQDNIDK